MVYLACRFSQHHYQGSAWQARTILVWRHSSCLCGWFKNLKCVVKPGHARNVEKRFTQRIKLHDKDLPWKNQWWTRHRQVEVKLTRFDDFTEGRIKILQMQITTLSIPTLLPNLASPTPHSFFNGENNRLCLTYGAVDSAEQNTALKWCGRFPGMFHDERAYKRKRDGTCYI